MNRRAWPTAPFPPLTKGGQGGFPPCSPKHGVKQIPLIPPFIKGEVPEGSAP
jgi:hypothetical protein